LNLFIRVHSPLLAAQQKPDILIPRCLRRGHSLNPPGAAEQGPVQQGCRKTSPSPAPSTLKILPWKIDPAFPWAAGPAAGEMMQWPAAPKFWFSTLAIT